MTPADTPRNNQPDEKKSRYKSTVPAVDQCMQVLNCLAESPRRQLSLSEICDMAGIHKSRGYTILNTLMAHNFIEKNPHTKVYKLGIGIVSLARNVLNDLNLGDIVNPHLQTLARNTDATAHYGVISGNRFYIVAKEESSDTFGYTMRLGIQHHLTHGAHGKAIVALMPEKDREQILAAEPLCFYGDGKPVDLDYLKEEFETIRELGYAVDLGETNPNITCISAPVTNLEGKLAGAIVLIGVFQRARVKTFGPMVVEAARRVSERMI